MLTTTMMNETFKKDYFATLGAGGKEGSFVTGLSLPWKAEPTL